MVMRPPEIHSERGLVANGPSQSLRPSRRRYRRGQVGPGALSAAGEGGRRQQGRWPQGAFWGPGREGGWRPAYPQIALAVRGGLPRQRRGVALGVRSSSDRGSGLTPRAADAATPRGNGRENRAEALRQSCLWTATPRR